MWVRPSGGYRMTVSELINALQIYDSELIVYIENDTTGQVQVADVEEGRSNGPVVERTVVIS